MSESAKKMLERSFFLKEDVVGIARELIGKYLFTNFDGHLTGGIISETEAYNGVHDRASHAWNGRKTKRTEVMYRMGGTAYVYLCYGVHSLFNVVTNMAGIPEAVLIRSIIPVIGTEFMLQRSGKTELNMNDGTGPGRVTKLLGIHYSHTGLDLAGDKSMDETDEIYTSKLIWIEDRQLNPEEADIRITKRVGVEYAGDDAGLPYRFVWKKRSCPFKTASL